MSSIKRDGKTIRTETLDGRRIGSFSLQSITWGHAAVLGNARLYIDDCTKARIVDFNGKVYREVHPKDLYKQGSRRFTDASVCAQGGKSSSDGRRILFDFATRKVPKLQHILESIHTISTLGMTGPEDVNGEEVRVMDTGNGKLCFGWHRSFPSMNWLVHSAAISPSGESVAIAAGDKLSIYRLPAVRWDSQDSLIDPRWLAIAVGIPLTRYPPHRSGRALVSASGSYLG